MMDFKSALRPALGWTYLLITVIFTAVTSVAVITEKVTLVEATPVIMSLLTIGAPVLAWVFGRTKEKTEAIKANVATMGGGGDIPSV